MESSGETVSNDLTAPFPFLFPFLNIGNAISRSCSQNLGMGSSIPVPVPKVQKVIPVHPCSDRAVQILPRPATWKSTWAPTDCAKSGLIVWIVDTPLKRQFIASLLETIHNFVKFFHVPMDWLTRPFVEKLLSARGIHRVHSIQLDLTHVIPWGLG